MSDTHTIEGARRIQRHVIQQRGLRAGKDEANFGMALHCCTHLSLSGRSAELDDFLEFVNHHRRRLVQLRSAPRKPLDRLAQHGRLTTLTSFYRIQATTPAIVALYVTIACDDSR